MSATAVSPVLTGKKERWPQGGSILSPAVSERNALLGAKPWWQPSRASSRISPPRGAQAAKAISDDQAVAPSEVGTIAATTEFVEDAKVCEVTFVRPQRSVVEMAVVVIPPLELLPCVEFAVDEVDLGLLELMTGGDTVPVQWSEHELPDGFHPTRDVGMPPMPIPSHIVRQRLSIGSALEPDDWGDHEVIYGGAEHPYLLSSVR